MVERPLQRLYRRALKPAPWRFWKADARALPDFLLIGTMRSGTTSLHDLLCRHPQVLPALKKEIHYFDLEYGRGRAWYRAHFPFRSALTRRAAITGEASPYYLSHPLAAGRAAGTAPEAKLVAVLRNPVDRAYSHYWHSVRLGVEALSFEDALAEEPSRLVGEVERLRSEPGYRSRAHQHQAYTVRSRYVDELAAWLAHFPRSRLLVLGREAFAADPAGQSARLFAFLGLEPLPMLPDGQLNRAQYTPMDPGLRAHLAAHFRPYNARLFELIGESLGWDD